jgi:hypothetical protein
MEILTSMLPSGGYGYDFPTLSVNPMTFMEICGYTENVPSEPLARYMYDIKVLLKDDPKILDCYVMDLDFLIFYKKLITVSGDLTYNLSVTCPRCGTTLTKKIDLNKDIHFSQIDQQIMDGAVIHLNDHKYDVAVPKVRDFIKVFEIYLRYKKLDDIKMIKTIAMIGDFDTRANQIEADVLGATHEDITLLLALRELYYDRIDPVTLTCPTCKQDGKEASVAVSVESLTVDFFRDICTNCPLDGTKILFK